MLPIDASVCITLSIVGIRVLDLIDWSLILGAFSLRSLGSSSFSLAFARLYIATMFIITIAAHYVPPVVILVAALR